MMFKHRLFKITDTPIVLGLLLVFVTWGAKHIVERVTATPLVEYRMTWMDNDKYEEWKKEYKTEVLKCGSRTSLPISKYNYLNITIKNLSDKLLLKNLSIAFGFPPDSPVKIKASQLLSKAPAIKRDNVETCDDDFVKIEKLNFHPRWEYTLVVATEGKGEPYAVLLKSDKATIFEKGGLKTWIVRNEVTIILISLLLGLGIAVLYLVQLSQITSGKSGDKQ